MGDSDGALVTPAGALVDGQWERLMSSYLAAKKPARWKLGMITSTGERVNVRRVGDRFVVHHRGLEVTLSPFSELFAMERAGIDVPPNIHELPNSDADFRHTVRQAHTGNRRPRRHAVKIPCAPGEPARG